MINTKKTKMAVAVLLTILIVPFSFAGEPRSKPFLPEIPQSWTQIFPEPTEYQGRNLSPTCIGLPNAGSYGAILGFPYIQETYPKSNVSILGDAGNGVVSDNFQNIYINNWGVQGNLPDWIPGFDRPIAEYDLDEMYKLVADYS